LEIFGPLLSGAAIVVASRPQATDATCCAHLISDHGVTIAQATPAHWTLLLQSGLQIPANLTTLCGGEALLPQLAERLASGSSTTWNLYGPTETTIWSTTQKLRKCDLGPSAASDAAPIGHPIGNTKIYVLDVNTEPVPIGVPGEIHIGGIGLMRGYWQRPDASAARLVPNHFVQHDSEQMYATGDIGRYLSDGTIEFLGRADQQVKIRGYRVELGEIENALEQHLGVARAIVLLKRLSLTDQNLAAYIEPREPNHLFSQDDLLAHLRKTLPSYMVPSEFFIVGVLPTTPNGKLDRNALIFLAPPAIAQTSRVKPSTITQQQLAEIWTIVLGQDVGITADFFACGGHSLRATQLISRINSRFGLSLPLSAAFAFPTVQVMAEQVELLCWLRGTTGASPLTER